MTYKLVTRVKSSKRPTQSCWLAKLGREMMTHIVSPPKTPNFFFHAYVAPSMLTVPLSRLAKCTPCLSLMTYPPLIAPGELVKAVLLSAPSIRKPSSSSWTRVKSRWPCMEKIQSVESLPAACPVGSVHLWLPRCSLLHITVSCPDSRKNRKRTSIMSLVGIRYQVYNSKSSPQDWLLQFPSGSFST